MSNHQIRESDRQPGAKIGAEIGVEALNSRLDSLSQANAALVEERRFLVDRLERLFEINNFAIRVGAQTRFMKTALMVCNELAARYDCDLVALGWLKGPYIRLRALSHVENFDARMEAAQQLETVMEEAFDQDAVIRWPRPVLAQSGSDQSASNQPQDERQDECQEAHSSGHAEVTRNHERYVRVGGIGHMISLPVRVGQTPYAVISAERKSRPFSADEEWEIALLSELVGSRLKDLEARDRWFGARWLAGLKSTLGRLWGVEHSLAKLLGVSLAAALLAGLLIDWPYRVEGAFLLRTEQVRVVPAPFDGYLARVHVDIGDRVEAGAALIDLDRSQLLLEEARIDADRQRYASEFDKAQGQRKLADMRTAEAQRKQAQARLAQVRAKLAAAQVKAAANGIVVEGELRQNIGAPMRKGDVLLKLANIESTYVDIEVDQVDIHEIKPGGSGEIAFVGRPDLRFPITIERINPVAEPSEGRNVFRVKARHDVAFQEWWRPGMGGSAKLDVEKRSLLWVMTHRSVRYLQRLFWL